MAKKPPYIRTHEVPVIIVARPVTAHGWMRRPELDKPNFYDAWELPNGDLCAVECGKVPTINSPAPGDGSIPV